MNPDNPPVIKLHRDRCIGAGICVVECDQTFDLGDDGLVVSLVEQVPVDLLSKVENAERECPSQTIEIVR